MESQSPTSIPSKYPEPTSFCAHHSGSGSSEELKAELDPDSSKQDDGTQQKKLTLQLFKVKKNQIG
jgi:hypothetical protein